MNQFDTINQAIESIKGKTKSELFASKSPFESISYSSPNYKNHKLKPFISEIYAEIDNLPFLDYLDNKLEYLINILKSDFESDPLLKINSNEVRNQRAHINYFISQLISKRLEINKIIEERKRNEDSNSEQTCLSRKETELLMRYLQKAHVILQYNNLNDSDLSMHFGAITGISSEQIRKDLSGNSRTDVTEISTRRENFDKLKAVLESIIKEIVKDSKPFN